MLAWLIGRIVSQTFEDERKAGRFTEDKAMQMGIRIHDKERDPDEYYVTLDLLLYGPIRYVKVCERKSWKPAIEGLKSGNTPWYLRCEHDSAWREDVNNFFNNRKDTFLTFSGPELFRWYSIVDVPPEIKNLTYERRFG
jgi:hypothetical protein